MGEDASARAEGLASAALGLLSRLTGSALDLLYPPTCAVCRQEGRFVCEGCEPELPKLLAPYCIRCASPGREVYCRRCTATPPHFDGVTAPYVHRGPVRDLVHNLKYNNVRTSAPELGRLMAGRLATLNLQADVLAPVPLHKRRERDRGYNQSLLLARSVSEATGIPLEERLLTRTRDTAPQVTMKSPEERRRNIEDAFECASELKGANLLLIDDVVTTGGTMSACAKPLKSAGAESVWGLALAR